MPTRYFADISSAGQHAGDFDAHEYRKAGALIVGIKATEGAGFTNPLHHEWCSAAHAEGLAVIHYHFAQPDDGAGADQQAAHFWQEVNAYAGPFDYLCDDYEIASRRGPHADCVFAQEFAAGIHHRSRYDPITYANRSFLETRGTALAPGRKRVWEADYSTIPNFNPPGCSTFARQRTNGQLGPTPHTIRGVNGPCDISLLNARTFLYLLANRARNHRAR